jgi:excisionase family DNA binding protein
MSRRSDVIVRLRYERGNLKNAPGDSMRATRNERGLKDDSSSRARVFPKVFFGVANAAAYIGVSRRQLLRYAEDGELRVIPIGQSFFFLRNDLDRFKGSLKRVGTRRARKRRLARLPGSLT